MPYRSCVSSWVLAGLFLLTPGCKKEGGAHPSSAQGSSNLPAGATKPDASKLAEDDGQWLTASKDAANTRYSRLKDIHAGNVKDLKLAWSWSTGLVRGHEAAPLVVGSTMYVVTPFPNRLVALDLTKEGAPVKWTYEPAPSPSAQGVACCDVVNRGASYADGRLFFNTLDAHTVAVDAQTGKELWKTKLGDINKGETMTMAPLVVRDRVIVGNAGGELGVRGWAAGLDTKTGAIAWRAYSTGPDVDVLIGPNFKPFYASDQGKDLGVRTWPPDQWKIGGGTVWGWVSYDAALDLVFYGTGNPGPWNPEQRPGDNKWTCGIFARRPSTGEAVWFYQWSPHDLYDHDGINESIVADLTVNGKPRQVLIHPGRTGYVYVLDRATGQVLSATPFGHITTSTGVDLKTGRLQPVPGMETGFDKTIRGICPASPGSKDWSPSAFNPETGMLYIPGNNLCQDAQGYEANYIAGTPYVGMNVKMYAGPGGNRGEFIGWDVAAGKKVFGIPEKFPVWSGVVVTAGDVAFYGTMDGWFKAVHARTGQELWKFKVGSGIIGQPITFRGPDGKQYVSVLSGVGGWAGAIVAGELDPRDDNIALGFGAAMKDLPQHTTRGGTLYTFALP
ncbi:PQQ-dependent dehydrogenase, methanol/ethanol family [Corallococcus interemptor]|uniref:PQQ-dependent dehydrogenase, methanol/ethanol family n=1 Tax=Corallococcus interemptor TaxID=2316720 RepID=A0A3A8QFE3_9BACT|nr:PQQ-dependent dehydrogenase, methanol/ethanol family [Corallococcus interemptor]